MFLKKIHFASFRIISSVWLPIILASGVLFSFVGTVVYFKEIKVAESRSIELARENALVITRLFEDLDWLVAHSAHEFPEHTKNENQDRIQNLLFDLKKSRSPILDILVLSETGKIRIWTGKGDPPEIWKHGSYQFQSKSRTGQIYIGSPQPSRTHNGKSVLGVSKAIRDEDGKLQSIGIAIVDIEALKAYYQPLPDKNGNMVALLSAEGKEILGFPGELLSPGSVPDYFPSTPPETPFSFDFNDGRKRLLYLYPMPDFGLFSMGAIDLDIALAEWWSEVRNVGLLWIIISIVSFTGALRLNHLSQAKEITDQEQRESEKALRESEERYRLITELTSDYTFRLAFLPDNHILASFVTDQFSNLTGFASNEVMSFETWSNFIHPDDLDRTISFFDGILARGGSDSIEIRFKTKEDSFIWIHIFARNEIEINNAEAPSVVGAVKNINKRKQAEIEREQYFNLFKTSSDLMCIINDQGCFIKTNPAFQEILGYPETELFLKPLFAFVHSEDLFISRSEIENLHTSGSTAQFENRYICKDGSLKWLSWRAVFDADEKLTYATARDITDSKHLHEQLIERDNDLQWAQKTAHLGYWSFDPRTEQLTWSEEMFRIFGLDEKEGPPDFETHKKIILSEDLATFEQSIQDAIRSGTPYESELNLTRPSGEKRTVVLVCTPQVNEEDTVMLLKGTIQDITDIRRSEEIIKENEQRLQGIANNIDEVIWISSPENRVLYANQMYEKVFGKPLEELLRNPMSYAESIHPEDRDRVFQAYLDEENVVNAVYSTEFRIVRPDGQIRWIWSRGYPIRDESGELKFRGGVASDITKRKEAELSLQEINETLARRVDIESVERLKTEAQYRTIFEISPEGLLLSNRNGRITRCNPASAAILGYRINELTGRSLFDLLADHSKQENRSDERENLSKIIEKIIHGKTVEVELNLKKTNGEPISILLLGTPFGSGEEEILYIWRDLTEIRNLQSEKNMQDEVLIQQSKMAEMGQMIGSIAHQWKQPVAALYALTDELSDQVEYNELTPENVLSVAKSIQKQAEFMNQTIEDFRKFLSPSRKQIEFIPCTSVEELLRIFNHQLMKNDASVVIHPHEHFKVLGYPNEFKQAILNIITNATDAFEERNPEEKRIHISFEQQGNMGVIQISDTGGGIPEELLPEKLFDSHVTTKGDKGTGIGLQIAKHILTRRMNGNIRAFNTNGGACFEITIPVAKVNESEPA